MIDLNNLYLELMQIVLCKRGEFNADTLNHRQIDRDTAQAIIERALEDGTVIQLANGNYLVSGSF